MKWINFLVISSLIVIVGCGGKKPSSPVLTIPDAVIPNIPDTFTAVSTDPDGDNIKYQFEWDTNVLSNWSEFLSSGTMYKTTYAYPNRGKYLLKCQVKDEKGKTQWSDPITVICGMGQIRWMLPADEDLDCEFNSTPAIDNQGNIYAGCTEGHLHSLNSSGQERAGWPFSSVAEAEFMSSPAIGSDGTIYACDRDGDVYAIYSNGNQKWVYHTDASDIVATPAIGRKNEIYVNTADGLYAISAQGQAMWYIESISGLSSVTIDQSNNLYVGTDDNYLYSLDTAGTIRWRYHVDGEIISSPAIMSNGKICFGAQDGYFYILNPDSTLVKHELVGTIASSPVIGSDGAIYISTDYGSLCRLSSNGVLDWEFSTDGGISSSPAVVKYPNISGDIIYFKVSWAKKKSKSLNLFQDDEDSLYMIKSDSTRLDACGVFQLNSSDEIVSSPMVGSDGTIYIGGGLYDGDGEGGLFALTGRGTVVNSSWPLFRRDTKNTGRVQ